MPSAPRPLSLTTPRRVLARRFAFLALAAVAVARGASAEGSTVARGEGIAVTAEELRARFAEVPSYQYPLFGADPAAALRTFLHDVVLGDALLARAAEDDGLTKRLRVRVELDRARANALLRALHEQGNEAVTDADVAAYYEAHKADFDAPVRVSVARILVATKAEGEALLKGLQADGAKLAAWNDLAREKSLDKGSSLRGGQLGFLAPDGSSSDAGVHVAPEIYAAAVKLADGELAKAPVPEGDKFALVWRRGSIPATKRPLEEAKGQIRTVLRRERDEKSKGDLIKDLRAKHLTDFTPDRVALIDIVPPTFVTPPSSARAPGAIPLPK